MLLSERFLPNNPYGIWVYEFQFWLEQPKYADMSHNGATNQKKRFNFQGKRHKLFMKENPRAINTIHLHFTLLRNKYPYWNTNENCDDRHGKRENSNRMGEKESGIELVRLDVSDRRYPYWKVNFTSKCIPALTRNLQFELSF